MHESYSVAQSTGAIWELCSTVNNMPKDNKSSLVEKQKQVLELVNDALFELEEVYMIIINTQSRYRCKVYRSRLLPIRC